MTGKKRLNPHTLRPFESGDLREDGRIFKAYKKNYTKKDGYLGEVWLLPETIDNDRTKQRFRTSKKRNAAKRHTQIPRRINPSTSKEFVIGDRDAKGRYFFGYRNYSYNGEYVHEEWGSKARWHRFHISQAVASAKRRAKRKNIDFNISVDYASEIFPQDNFCPALGIKMSWGTLKSRYNSPSLDRIVPEAGYVEGNVVWISLRANLIKNDASPDEVLRVATFLKSITNTPPNTPQ